MNRITQNPITTITGAVIILACLAFVFFEKATAVDVSGWFTTGLMLLVGKDEYLKK